MWKCGKVNQKTRVNENERQTFDAGKMNSNYIYR